MRMETFTIVTGGAALDASLSFRATAISIDNYTNQWVYIPSLDRFIPPGRVNYSLPLDGTTRARAQFLTPPGQTAAAVVAGQVARFVYADVPLPSDSGQQLEAGKLRTYGPFVRVNPAALLVASQCFLADTVTDRVVLLSDCVITRLYMTASAPIAAAAAASWELTKNGAVPPADIVWPAPISGPLVPFDSANPTSTPPLLAFFANFPSLVALGSGATSNVCALGDFLQAFLNTNAAWGPAVDTLSLYIETTDLT